MWYHPESRSLLRTECVFVYVCVRERRERRKQCNRRKLHLNEKLVCDRSGMYIGRKEGLINKFFKETRD